MAPISEFSSGCIGVEVSYKHDIFGLLVPVDLQFSHLSSITFEYNREKVVRH